jgi:hypothetical protein
LVAKTQQPLPSTVNDTEGTFEFRFDKVKHILSPKPLRRPRRRLATDLPIPIESTGNGLTRREAIQRRMPPRGRIQEIIDRRPARDPWLDDEHDWRS